MTKPIVRLYALVLVLIGILVFATSWWTVFGAESLRDNPNNRRELLESAKIKRGVIRAADGRVLARSVKAPGDTYRRTYPTGGLFAHAIGYSYTNIGRCCLEQFRNDALTGQRPELTSLLDQLTGKRRDGDDVTTALDPRAQQVAIDALGGQKGAIVAYEPDTGKVRVMVSVPGFDPNLVSDPDEFRRLNRDDENAPLFNRVTQSGYPPGSTMKVVTALAAIDSGKFSPESVLSGKNGIEISGVPLNNFGGQDFGDVDLTTALTNSINTVWAQVGEQLGKATMAKYMTRLGFYAKPPLDYPSGQKRASGEYGENGRLLNPLSPRIDVGRMAIGQDKLAVTPLQMAMVAATVANGGVLVRPHMTTKIVDPDGRVVDDVPTDELERVVSTSTAEKVSEMMRNVVREGSGTAAALAGIEVAGKTGTAEINIPQDITQPWFIGFAPASDPKIAIAVTVERTQGGTGGTVAAPIARQVMEALL